MCHPLCICQLLCLCSTTQPLQGSHSVERQLRDKGPLLASPGAREKDCAGAPCKPLLYSLPQGSPLGSLSLDRHFPSDIAFCALCCFVIRQHGLQSNWKTSLFKKLRCVCSSVKATLIIKSYRQGWMSEMGFSSSPVSLSSSLLSWPQRRTRSHFRNLTYYPEYCI